MLRVTGHGVLGGDQIRTMSHEVIDAIHRRGLTHVLVDCRELQPNIDTIDIYRLPELYRERALDRAVRVAIVANPQSDKMPDFKFYETVSYNTGYQIRLFTDMDAARQWLKA